MRICADAALSLHPGQQKMIVVVHHVLRYTNSQLGVLKIITIVGLAVVVVIVVGGGGGGGGYYYYYYRSQWDVLFLVNFIVHSILNSISSSGG